MEKIAERVIASFHDELTKLAAHGVGLGGFLPGLTMGAVGALYLQQKLRDMRMGQAMRQQQSLQQGY